MPLATVRNTLRSLPGRRNRSIKGLPGLGLLTHLTLSNYGDYLSMYRLEDILSGGATLLRRSTLCGWIVQTADLLKRLYE